MPKAGPICPQLSVQLFDPCALRNTTCPSNLVDNRASGETKSGRIFHKDNAEISTFSKRPFQEAHEVSSSLLILDFLKRIDYTVPELHFNSFQNACLQLAVQAPQKTPLGLHASQRGL